MTDESRRASRSLRVGDGDRNMGSDLRSWIRGSAGVRLGEGAVGSGDFHRTLPGYRPTPLVECADLAADLGVARLFVKDESNRFGLPSFKILGVSWAVHQVLSEFLGGPRSWSSHQEMRADVQGVSDRILLTATAGNHGRALARVAQWLGLDALVLVPSDASATAVYRIESEGATVRRVLGGYDAAVDEAAALGAADDRYLFIQDTAWPDYEQVPAWIVDGYETLFREIEEQLASSGAKAADVLVVPVGVGSLMMAALKHVDGRESSRTAVVSVETESAPCVLVSLITGTNVQVPTSPTVIEALNAGTISSAAYPIISAGVDAAVVVSDGMAARAQVRLNDLGIAAGICGGASLAGIAHLLERSDPAAQASWSISPESIVVVISTDGL